MKIDQIRTQDRQVQSLVSALAGLSGRRKITLLSPADRPRDFVVDELNNVSPDAHLLAAALTCALGQASSIVIRRFRVVPGASGASRRAGEGESASQGGEGDNSRDGETVDMLMQDIYGAACKGGQFVWLDADALRAAFLTDPVTGATIGADANVEFHAGLG